MVTDFLVSNLIYLLSSAYISTWITNVPYHAELVGIWQAYNDCLNLKHPIYLRAWKGQNLFAAGEDQHHAELEERRDGD